MQGGRSATLLMAAALALVSCKADLAHHDAQNGGASGSSGGATGTGGTSAATGGAGGRRDGGASGSGGIPVGSGGISGTGGASSGGASGRGGMSTGGSGGLGGMSSTGTGGLAGSGSGGVAGAGGAAPPCTPTDTRCTAQGMQTCNSQGAWGAAAACASTICSGTKCLPKAALLIVAYDALYSYDATTGAFSSSFAFNETSLYASTFGPDGKLWLADDKAKTIVRYDLSGASLGVFTTIPTYCQAMAFGPDGNLYVSAETSPRQSIVRINATTGASLGTFMQGPLDLSISGMTFHSGSLFVTYGGSGDALGGSLYQYDATTGAQVAVLYDQFSPYGPNTPAFAPDGTLYVPVWQTFDIGKFDATTLKFVSYVSLDKLYPTSIAVVPDGTLLVLSDPLGGVDSVLRYDPKTAAFTTLVPAGTGGVGRAHTVYYRGP